MTPPRFAEPEEVQMLWSCGYWDGPLSGVALLHGRKVWFEAVSDETNYRDYMLYALTDDEVNHETLKHNRFKEAVGPHTSYIYVNGRRQREGWFSAAAKPDWHDYYDNPEPFVRPKYTDREPIGWFGRSPHRARPRSVRYFERAVSGRVGETNQ